MTGRMHEPFQQYGSSCTCEGSFILQMLHLRLWAVREDHFQKVAPGWPSEGVIVISKLHEHVWDLSAIRSSELLSEAHWHHVSAHAPWGLCVNCWACHVSILRTTSHVLAMLIVLCLLAYWSASHFLTMQIVLHTSALHVTDGPSGAAGGPRGPLLKSCAGLAIRRSYKDAWPNFGDYSSKFFLKVHGATCGLREGIHQRQNIWWPPWSLVLASALLVANPMTFLSWSSDDMHFEIIKSL